VGMARPPPPQPRRSPPLRRPLTPPRPPPRTLLAPRLLRRPRPLNGSPNARSALPTVVEGTTAALQTLTSNNRWCDEVHDDRVVRRYGRTDNAAHKRHERD